jgi:hypothetical protein
MELNLKKRWLNLIIRVDAKKKIKIHMPMRAMEKVNKIRKGEIDKIIYLALFFLFIRSLYII